MQLDPLHVIIALGPLAAYFVLLGLLNLSRRPLVTTGARDVAALEVALTQALRRTTNSPNPYAIFPLSFGLLMALLVGFLTFSNPGMVAQSLIEMFRL